MSFPIQVWACLCLTNTIKWPWMIPEGNWFFGGLRPPPTIIPTIDMVVGYSLSLLFNVCILAFKLHVWTEKSFRCTCTAHRSHTQDLKAHTNLYRYFNLKKNEIHDNRWTRNLCKNYKNIIANTCKLETLCRYHKAPMTQQHNLHTSIRNYNRTVK